MAKGVSLAEALATPLNLTSHDGKMVIATTVAITNAGDGLSKAMKIKPVELHHGQEVCIVLRGRVGPIEYVPTDTDDPNSPLVRKQKIRAGTATLVDEALVKTVLDEQELAIKAAEDAARGQGTIDQALEESENGAKAPARRRRTKATAAPEIITGDETADE